MMSFSFGVIASAFKKIVAAAGGAAFVADANTSLLMHFDVAPIADETGKAITNNGAVAVVADAAAIGGFAASFSGSNSPTTPQVASLTFGTNPFTIEFYLTASVTGAAQWLVTGFVGDGRNDFYLKLNASGKLEWSDGMNNYTAMTGVTAVKTGARKHIAICVD